MDFRGFAGFLGVPGPRKSFFGSGWSRSMPNSVRNSIIFRIFGLWSVFSVSRGVFFSDSWWIHGFPDPRGQNRTVAIVDAGSRAMATPIMEKNIFRKPSKNCLPSNTLDMRILKHVHMWRSPPTPAPPRAIAILVGVRDPRTGYVGPWVRVVDWAWTPEETSSRPRRRRRPGGSCWKIQ